MEEIETTSEPTSDVDASASSDTSTPEAGEAAQTAAPTEKEIDWSKAFEHPRFKELVGQKNEATSRYQDIESKYKALEQQLSSLKESQPKAPTEFDGLIEDLKKIDPRLAGAMEAQAKAAKNAEALQARLEAFEKTSQESTRQAQVQAAVAKVNQMHESNKVTPEVKQFINDKIDLLYMQGKLTPQNIEESYKSVYEPIKKVFEDLRRSERESYVKEKTKDSSIPASIPKGTQAKPGQKPFEAPRDKEALKAAVVKSFMKEQAAQRDATNN